MIPPAHRPPPIALLFLCNSVCFIILLQLCQPLCCFLKHQKHPDLGYSPAATPIWNHLHQNVSLHHCIYVFIQSDIKREASSNHIIASPHPSLSPYPELFLFLTLFAITYVIYLFSDLIILSPQ